MDVTVEIHCGGCGSANYGLPGGPEDSGPVVCNDCGRTFGSFAELKAELVVQALERSAEALRSALPKTRGGAA